MKTEQELQTERPKPYIGISGVVDTGQQYYLMDQFCWSGLEDEPYSRQIALGVKAVHKTQFLDIPNKYGTDWYPVGEEAFEHALEPEGLEALRVAQVCFDTEHVRDEQYRDEFMDRIRQRGRAWLNAVQFDMLPWHCDETVLPFVERIKNETGLKVLLQVHSDSMNALGPAGIVHRLGIYAHALDYILFDASHGKGVRLNSDALRSFVGAAYESDELQSVGIGVAGGLNGEVVRENLAALVRDFPDLSWDAEGQLHPVDSSGARPINMRAAKEYINASSDVLQSVYN